MKPEDVEMKLKHMAVKSPTEGLDSRIAAMLGRDDISDDGLSVDSRVFARRRLVAVLSAAIAVIMAIAIARVFFRDSHERAIAFADVARSFREAIETCERIHLVKTNRRVFRGLDIDDVVERVEVWVQRPTYMREESTWTISDAVTEDERSTYIVPSGSIIKIHNESGTLELRSDTRRWGMRSADAIDLWHNVPYRELIESEIDKYLRTRFYANWDTHDAVQGSLVEHTEVNGEAATVYDFTRNESTEYEQTCRCWLRDSDNRLARMEVFPRENKQDPAWIYYPIEYDPEIPEKLFAHEIPEAYKNAHVLGFEEQPYEMNPELVAVVHETESAKIYKLSLQPGQSREQAVAAAIAKDQPQIHLYLHRRRPEVVYPNVKLTGTEVGFKNGSPRIWTIGGITSITGSHSYGVRRPGADYSDLVSPVDFDGTGRVMFEQVIYRTDRTYAKLAYDADGDGVMDAWCEVPAKTPRD